MTDLTTKALGDDQDDANDMKLFGAPPVVGDEKGSARSSPWLVGSLVAVGYVLGSEAAFRFAEATDLQAVFFIPSGITFAALVRSRRADWWVVLLAVAVAEFGQDLRAGLSVAQSVGFAAANVAEPLVGAAIVLARVRGRLDLSRLWHVRWFVVGGVVAGPAVGAAIGALVDRGFGGDSVVTTFWQWWLGDVLGVLLVGGPLLAAGSGPDRRSLWSGPGAVVIIGAVVLTATVLTTSDLPLMFIVLTGVVVAGAWFGVRAVAFVSAIVALTAAAAFVIGDGAIMVGVSDATGLVVIKLKFLVFTTGGLVVAAEMYERDLLALERARLQIAAAEEHRLVTRFQRLSLPPEQLAGSAFTAEGCYMAAASGLGIGGDWYDVAELPDGRVYICVGDVVGHGAEAAVTMNQLRVAMSVTARHVEGPSALLSQADEIAATIPGASCSTVWVGFFDPPTGCLTYASAGHPPGFLLSCDGVSLLDGRVSAPLTVVPDAPKPETTVHIGRESSVLLYTDGLIDRRDGTVVDGQLAEIASAIEALRSTSGGFTVAGLESFAGQTDDTILLHVVLRSATV
ncbi:MAG: SpoIIE family protein phosphatase [Ilumatobacteraceae bacterium]|nr:SpoIIE family protein phosphatase [Ilumatobacteraceae bacterium]